MLYPDRQVASGDLVCGEVTNSYVSADSTTVVTTDFWCEYVVYSAFSPSTSTTIEPTFTLSSSASSRRLKGAYNVDSKISNGGVRKMSRKLDMQPVDNFEAHAGNSDWKLALEHIEAVSLEEGRDPKELMVAPLPSLLNNLTYTDASMMWGTLVQLTTLHPWQTTNNTKTGTFGCGYLLVIADSTLTPYPSSSETSYYFPTASGQYEGWNSQSIKCTFVNTAAVVSVDPVDAPEYLVADQLYNHGGTSAPTMSVDPTEAPSHESLGEEAVGIIEKVCGNRDSKRALTLSGSYKRRCYHVLSRAIDVKGVAALSHLIITL